MTQNAHDTTLVAPPRPKACATTQLPTPGRLGGASDPAGPRPGSRSSGCTRPTSAPTAPRVDSTGFFMELAHGRASALFAFLAGFSIALITGRLKTGRAGRQAVAKVVIRAPSSCWSWAPRSP